MSSVRDNYRKGPTEAELKARLLTELLRQKRIGTKATLANELPVDLRSTRADLAVLDGSFLGIEIKSNRDSLKRLDKQLAVYREYFDITLLLVGDRHLRNVSTIEMDNLELWVANENTLELVKAPEQKSPSSRCEQLINAFRNRFDATSRKFWRTVKGREIKTRDLRLLSRFAAQRELAAAMAEQRSSQWQQWQTFLSSHSVQSSSVS